MKQKVVVKTIIKRSGKVLLLRRHGGRPSIDGLYELPGGRVRKNQQPKDALTYALKAHLGAKDQDTQLLDVITFIDPDDRELQYVFIIFTSALCHTSSAITLSTEYDKYIWKKLSDVQRNEITQSTQQILNMPRADLAAKMGSSALEKYDVISTSNNKKLVGYSDGGSRGNPGPAATGYVLLNTTGKVVDQGSAYIGEATNSIAEYMAVYQALRGALRLRARVVEMRLDSQIVARQMNTARDIKDREIAQIYDKIKKICERFEKVSFSHVPREYNELADGLVNKVLDEYATKASAESML